MDPSTTHRFPLVELFGLPFTDARDAMAVAEDLLSGSWRHRLTDVDPVLVTPNVDVVVQGAAPELRAMQNRFRRCAYVLADGAPIVWASRLAGTPLQARIAGSSLFRHWWPRVIAERRSVVVVCSSDAVRTGLLAEYDQAEVIVAPRIDTSPDQIDLVADLMVTAALTVDAEFCVVGIGHPKDPLVALAGADRWPNDRPPPLFMALGASAEMHLGIKKRAPDWIQRTGLEWFFRFLQEPRRMFRRYFIRDARFLPMAVKEAVTRRRSRPSAPSARSPHDRDQSGSDHVRTTPSTR